MRPRRKGHCHHLMTSMAETTDGQRHGVDQTSANATFHPKLAAGHILRECGALRLFSTEGFACMQPPSVMEFDVDCGDPTVTYKFPNSVQDHRVIIRIRFKGDYPQMCTG